VDQLPLDEGAPNPAFDPDPAVRTDKRAHSKRVTKAKHPAKAKKHVVLADVDPVAAVIVDVNVASLDHTFDYLVPEGMATSAVPGTRVRVRFAGRLVDGYIVARRAESEHQGRLATLNRVLGGPVLTDEVAALARLVADRYAGTMSEVLRDAIPPRHAATEKAWAQAATAGDVDGGHAPRGTSLTESDAAVWSHYDGSAALLKQLRRGTQVRVSLTVAAADDPVVILADLAAATPGPVVVVVPDVGDLERFEPVFRDRFPKHLAVLSAADTPARRYQQFLLVGSGHRTVVLGTRSAVFAPVNDPALIVVWDDSDDSLVEPRAPGWHAREVAALRSLETSASLVIAGHFQSVEVARMASRNWLQPIQADRARRQAGAKVATMANARGGDPTVNTRIPQFAWQVLRNGLRHGPVLVQVGRGGYLPTVACQQCRTVAKCEVCTGPLGRAGVGSELACQWCGKAVADFHCVECGASELRAVRLGSHRTAEELQAAFPEVNVRVSGSDTGVLRSVSSEPHIVVATVGAEPVADGGYGAAVLLDGNAMLARADLRSEEQTVRRWFNAVALVKAADDGGAVAVTADPAHRAVQALVRADPAGWALRELADREATGLPPASRAAVVFGASSAVDEFLATCTPKKTWRVLGPTSVETARTGGEVRVVVLAPIQDGALLASQAKLALTTTPATTDGHRLRLRIDPTSLLG
jgi:primosomal protein N' (replication factor Y)